MLSYKDLKNHDKRAINWHYWCNLEHLYSGYGDLRVLERLKVDLGVSLSWDELLKVFRECEYGL